MNSKHKKTIIGIVLTIILFKFFPAYGAESIRPEDYNKPEFKKAFGYRVTNQTIKLKAELRRLANQYKGGDVGAVALLWLAMKQTNENASLTYDEIIRDYPNTRWWLIARISKVGRAYNYNEEFDTWLEKHNEVIESIGGISIYRIMRKGNIAFNSKKIDHKYRIYLANYYFNLGNIISSKHLDAGINVLRFVRENFPKFSWDDPGFTIQTEILDSKGIYNWRTLPKDTRPPTVWPIHPRPGSRAGRRRPWIKFKAFDGDISQSQIDLPKLVFTLDGQDLTNDMKVRSKIDKSGKVHKCRPWKHPFEVLKIRYRPKHKLTPGKHTIYIKVPDGLGHVTEKTWTFRVKKGCRHPDDDKNDDEVRPEE